MLVLNIIGTRPEAIKMAPIIRELAQHPATVRGLTCVTGQHRDLVGPVLDLFGIEPDHELQTMQPSQSLAQLTAALIEGLDGVLEETRPDWVLAQGDTTTVLAASLVAGFHQVRFGHVEAGLRTFEKMRPFPEELNRRLADTVADAWFAPTPGARRNLLREGIPSAAIHVTGNTGIDALLEIVQRPFTWEESRLGFLDRARPLVLITAHRREHFGEPLREIAAAIGELAAHYEGHGVQFVWPVHPNPEVRRPIQELLPQAGLVHLVPPLDYLSTVQLLKQTALLLTDSGGLQEEAPSFGVPVVLLRDTTERPEGVEAGFVHLAGTNRHRIISAARAVLDGRTRANTGFVGTPLENPYGDGHAAERIVSVLCGAFSRRRIPIPVP